MLGHVASSSEVQILTATDAPAFLLVKVFQREARERSWRKITRCLKLDLMLVGWGRAGSLMQIFWIDVKITLLADNWRAN